MADSSMTPNLHPPLPNFDFSASLTADGLMQLDHAFLAYLRAEDAALHKAVEQYRAEEVLSAEAVSELVIACAPILERFMTALFQIEKEAETLRHTILEHDPIFIFKDHYLHQAKRLTKVITDTAQFDALQDWLMQQLQTHHFHSSDLELSVAQLGVQYLSNQPHFSADIEKLTHWCVLAPQTEMGACIIKNWRSFRQPHKKHFENLVPMVPVENDPFARFEAPKHTQRHREGFDLTDTRMPLRDVLDEIHYCVYCHKNEGDFCSKGFPVKKNNPELGLKINPAGDILTGCPLEEKISEMHVVKKSGFSIGALAIIMIDNPLCAVTGHRICNDCMKACIYQKQDPVNIPEIETRVLTDVLELPWGVEIYDLLIRWNPLRKTQYVPKKYNDNKVLVVGMGPAGFTMAHHLLMEGCAVVGVDGLKIEPLPSHLLSTPIRDFNTLKESLDDRIMLGFGGVTEYGITVRWDKNFLKLIYLSLLRRPHFQVFGNVRLGGTITIEDAWKLGFDHVSLAVGAGLSRELSIPNSLAPGMRQANDFLMALQLTGAVKKSSLANLQVRLPAIVIGGGLTGIDTATEIQAYYIVQIEKIHQRYHILKSTYGEADLRLQFDAQSLDIIDEFLSHADTVIAERDAARAEKRQPNFNKLIRGWGGVTIAYRKSIQESPAYQRNHEEVIKALEEGIYYAEGLEPTAVLLDPHGAVNALTCRWRIQDEEGKWIYSNEEQTLPANSIFVATGAKPNIAYEFEHRGTFVRAANAYQGYEDTDGTLIPLENNGHVKEQSIGVFTSYDKADRRVSFLGDTHPLFHGSVVKAIASAKRSYPDVIAVLKNKTYLSDLDNYAVFHEKIKQLFDAQVIAVVRHTHNIVELTVEAVMAAKQFQPGQFYRIQNYETSSLCIDNTKLQTETLSALGIAHHNPRYLSFFIIENGASSKLISTLKIGQPISIMGPTGAKTRIPDTAEHILIVGNALAIIYLLSVGPALKAAGHHIHFMCNAKTSDQFAVERIQKIADSIVFCESEEAVLESMQIIKLDAIQSIFVIGPATLLKKIQHARQTRFKNQLHDNVKFTASVYGSMQCMLKGVCAQCLQWQIDPTTGKRTKAVYACSWQHQPMEIIDIDHMQERLAQNRPQEILTNLWVQHLFLQHELARV